MSETSDIATERGAADRSDKMASMESDADRMRDELRSVIASPDFARAPIMKRLLAFLVGETAAGRGDQLKAYSVAVDGLGRAPDYDARADSYPRVQVGRLRRMLDNHYATTAPRGGLRLTIPSGRYRVTLQPSVVAEETESSASSAQLLPTRPWLFGWQIALLLIVMVLGTLALLQAMPIRSIDPDTGRSRPTLQLGGITMARESRLGNLVRATLINGLGRSNIYDLRPLPRSGKIDPKAPPARYGLGTDLIEGEHPRLFLRLSSTTPDRLIWSGDVSLAGVHSLDGETLDRTLAPAIAAIGRANGLIATHELQEHGGLEAAGYSCLLLYHHYRKQRTLDELRHVETCVERSLKLNPNDSEMQAAAAQLSIEKMVRAETPARDREPLLQTARRHAQIAASIDPFDAWSNAALARVALARGACAQTVNFAIRAARIQPYDPALLADVGIYLLSCEDPRAETYLRRAIALADDPDGRLYAPILLLAVAHDDGALAREALAHMAPSIMGQNGRFYLTSATGYAMIGDIGRARAAWQQLKADSPSIAGDPQGFFERLGLSAGLRAKAMAHLRAAKLIAG